MTTEEKKRPLANTDALDAAMEAISVCLGTLRTLRVAGLITKGEYTNATIKLAAIETRLRLHREAC